MSEIDKWRLVVDYNPSTGIFTRKSIGDDVFRAFGVNPTAKRVAWAKKLAGKRVGYFCGKRIKIEVLGRKISAHRLAWFFVTGLEPTNHIDHINGDPSDNRFCNLRECTHRQNMRNRKPFGGAKSKYLGVEYCCNKDQYRAAIRTTFGVFRSSWNNSERRAAEIYNEVAPKLHGEFARINVIESPGQTVSVADPDGRKSVRGV